MHNAPAGSYDRRIMIQIATPVTDAAGDVVNTSWADAFKLWAERMPKSPGIERPTPAGVLREFDMVLDVRFGTKSRSIAPETHRVLYKGRIYEIVGMIPGKVRGDRITLLTSSRPDQRGSRGDEGQSGEP